MISDREFRMAVGERLKRLRLAFGRSQQDVADKLDVGATAISNYEKGDRAIDPYDALKLKMAYGAPLEWLYGGDESTLPDRLVEKLNQPVRPRGQSEPAPVAKRAKKSNIGSKSKRYG
jgi:transcriptional regulator with XRE-family HTH domain